MIGLLPSALALSLVAVVAILQTTRTRTAPIDPVRLRQVAQALAVTAGIQAVHFAEELTTGFHQRFPALFNLPPMPLAVFVGFNLAWLAVWSVSVAWIRNTHPVPLFAAWFLGIAGVANGIAHPLISAAAGGYFPGLFTSPFIGLAGLWLWRRLARLAD